jgi:hypothetical protein
MPKIDNIDKFGNCVSCHRHLIKNIIVGGKVQGVLDADASDSFFKLNTGSILVVPICKPCKSTMDLDDPTVQSNIMDEVNNGWKLELDYMKSHPDAFPDSNCEKELAIKDLYEGLSIVSHEANHKVGVR